MNLDEFKDYLPVDKTRLDDELVNQASLLGEVSDQYSVASNERDDLKEKLALADAELADEARQNLTGKVTEAMVTAYVQQHPRHLTAYKAYATARLQASRLGALKEAFVTKGYRLRDLCTLYVANYFEDGASKATPQTERVRYLAIRERLNEARKSDV